MYSNKKKQKNIENTEKIRFLELIEIFNDFSLLFRIIFKNK